MVEWPLACRCCLVPVCDLGPAELSGVVSHILGTKPWGDQSLLLPRQHPAGTGRAVDARHFRLAELGMRARHGCLGNRAAPPHSTDSRPQALLLCEKVKRLRSALLGVPNLGSDATGSGTTGMGIAGSRDCRNGDCSDGDHSDEDIRRKEYQDGHRRGGDSRFGDHSDGGVFVHLVRPMEMMLKGTISENSSQGRAGQAACQWGQSSGSILASFGGGFGLDL